MALPFQIELEDQVDSLIFNEIDKNDESQCVLRTLVNYQFINKMNGEMIHFNEIGKKDKKVQAIGEVIEPLPLQWREEINELLCTVETKLDVHHLHDEPIEMELDRKNLKAGDYVDGYCNKTFQWFDARIVEVDADIDMMKVHFKGWNTKYDEWLPIHSDRIAAAGSSKKMMIEAAKKASKFIPWYKHKEIYDRLSTKLGKLPSRRSKKILIPDVEDCCIDYAYGNPSLWIISRYSQVWYRIAGVLCPQGHLGQPLPEYYPLFQSGIEKFECSAHVAMCLLDSLLTNPNMNLQVLAEEVAARSRGVVNEITILNNYAFVIEQMKNLTEPADWDGRIRIKNCAFIKDLKKEGQEFLNAGGIEAYISGAVKGPGSKRRLSLIKKSQRDSMSGSLRNSFEDDEDDSIFTYVKRIRHDDSDASSLSQLGGEDELWGQLVYGDIKDIHELGGDDDEEESDHEEDDINQKEYTEALQHYTNLTYLHDRNLKFYVNSLRLSMKNSVPDHIYWYWHTQNALAYFDKFASAPAPPRPKPKFSRQFKSTSQRDISMLIKIYFVLDNFRNELNIPRLHIDTLEDLLTRNEQHPMLRMIHTKLLSIIITERMLQQEEFILPIKFFTKLTNNDTISESVEQKMEALQDNTDARNLVRSILWPSSRGLPSIKCLSDVEKLINIGDTWLQLLLLVAAEDTTTSLPVVKDPFSDADSLLQRVFDVSSGVDSQASTLIHRVRNGWYENYPTHFMHHPDESNMTLSTSCLSQKKTDDDPTLLPTKMLFLPNNLKVGSAVDCFNVQLSAWYKAKIIRITRMKRSALPFVTPPESTQMTVIPSEINTESATNTANEAKEEEGVTMDTVNGTNEANEANEKKDKAVDIFDIFILTVCYFGLSSRFNEDIDLCSNRIASANMLSREKVKRRMLPSETVIKYPQFLVFQENSMTYILMTPENGASYRKGVEGMMNDVTDLTRNFPIADASQNFLSPENLLKEMKTISDEKEFVFESQQESMERDEVGEVSSFTLYLKQELKEMINYDSSSQSRAYDDEGDSAKTFDKVLRNASISMDYASYQYSWRVELLHWLCNQFLQSYRIKTNLENLCEKKNQQEKVNASLNGTQNNVKNDQDSKETSQRLKEYLENIYETKSNAESKTMLMDDIIATGPVVTESSVTISTEDNHTTSSTINGTSTKRSSERRKSQGNAGAEMNSSRGVKSPKGKLIENQEPERNLSENTSKMSELQERLKQKLEKAKLLSSADNPDVAIRFVSIGLDRFGNEYWVLPIGSPNFLLMQPEVLCEEKCSQEDYLKYFNHPQGMNSGLAPEYGAYSADVSSWDTSRWIRYSHPEDIYNLITWLNEAGANERHLKTFLFDWLEYHNMSFECISKDTNQRSFLTFNRNSPTSYIVNPIKEGKNGEELALFSTKRKCSSSNFGFPTIVSSTYSQIMKYGSLCCVSEYFQDFESYWLASKNQKANSESILLAIKVEIRVPFQLGVGVREISEGIVVVESYKYDSTTNISRGKKSGLKIGDQICMVNGEYINSIKKLIVEMKAVSEADKVKQTESSQMSGCSNSISQMNVEDQMDANGNGSDIVDNNADGIQQNELPSSKYVEFIILRSASLAFRESNLNESSDYKIMTETLLSSWKEQQKEFLQSIDKKIFDFYIMASSLNSRISTPSINETDSLVDEYNLSSTEGQPFLLPVPFRHPLLNQKNIPSRYLAELWLLLISASNPYCIASNEWNKKKLFQFLKSLSAGMHKILFMHDEKIVTKLKMELIQNMASCLLEFEDHLFLTGTVLKSDWSLSKGYLTTPSNTTSIVIPWHQKYSTRSARMQWRRACSRVTTYAQLSYLTSNLVCNIMWNHIKLCSTASRYESLKGTIPFKASWHPQNFDQTFKEQQLVMFSIYDFVEAMKRELDTLRMELIERCMQRVISEHDAAESYAYHEQFTMGIIQHVYTAYKESQYDSDEPKEELVTLESMMNTNPFLKKLSELGHQSSSVGIQSYLKKNGEANDDVSGTRKSFRPMWGNAFDVSQYDQLVNAFQSNSVGKGRVVAFIQSIKYCTGGPLDDSNPFVQIGISFPPSAILKESIPTSIASPSLTPHTWTIHEYSNRLLLILDTVLKFNPCKPFLTPVSSLDFPDYHTVITSPIDLQIIQEKIQQHKYFEKDDFLNDMKTLYENCKLFCEESNGSSLKIVSTAQKIYEDAINLCNVFELPDKVDGQKGERLNEENLNDHENEGKGLGDQLMNNNKSMSKKRWSSSTLINKDKGKESAVELIFCMRLSSFCAGASSSILDHPDGLVCGDMQSYQYQSPFIVDWNVYQSNRTKNWQFNDLIRLRLGDEVYAAGNIRGLREPTWKQFEIDWQPHDEQKNMKGLFLPLLNRSEDKVVTNLPRYVNFWEIEIETNN